MPRFNTGHLHTFLEVVRSGGVRRAAQGLKLTQPAVSARIRLLEDALGVRLTRHGQMLIRHAEQFEHLHQDVTAHVAAWAGLQDQLRLGVAESVAQSWLPDVVTALHTTFRKVEIEIDVDVSTNLRDRLLGREIDLAFLMGPVSEAIRHDLSRTDILPLVRDCLPALAAGLRCDPARRACRRGVARNPCASAVVAGARRHGRRTRNHRTGLYNPADPRRLGVDHDRDRRHDRKEAAMTRPEPVLPEIVSAALVVPVAEEMSVTVWRTSRSTTVRELPDCSTAVFDARSRNVDQAARMPAHLHSMELCLQHIAEHHLALDDWQDGDVIVTNDPCCGEQHLPDFIAFRPVFRDGVRIAITCVLIHHVDVGGGAAGGYNAHAVEVFQEGLRLPPVPIVRNGRMQDDLFATILQNLREPETFRGDFLGPGAALDVGARAMLRLADRQGVQALDRIGAALLDHAEQEMRAALEAKTIGHALQPGDIVQMETPGGGGDGDPASRALAAAEQDKADGYVQG